MIFATGSRVYGKAHSGSDWDFCVPIWELQALVDTITGDTGRTAKPSPYNAGVKIVLGGCLDQIVINIIPLHPQDFVAWYYTTKFMKKLPEIEDRDLRHRVFEHLIPTVKDAYNGTVCTIASLKKWAENRVWVEDGLLLERLIEPYIK